MQRAQTSIESSLDFNAVRMVASFTDGSSSSTQGSDGAQSIIITETREAERVVLVAGGEPGHSIIQIPMKNFGPGKWDEVGGQVALRKDGAGKIKPRSRCKVDVMASGQTTPVFCGTVAELVHDLGQDMLLVTVLDDKFRLGKITTWGTMQYDPIKKRHFWDEGRPLIFNLGGHPDCLDTPFGPRFAPGHRFGYKDVYNGETASENFDEPDPGKATERTRSWRVVDALQYLRDAHYTEGGSKAPVQKVTHPNQTVSAWTKWPAGFGSSIGDPGIRKLRNVSCENMSLVQSLTTILRRAGAFDLWIKAGDDFISTMYAVNMNPVGATGTTLVLATPGQDISSALNDQTSVNGGYVKESIVNYFDNAQIIGDPPSVERFLTMDTSGEGLIDGKPSLEQAWSDADETAFKAYMTANGNDLTAFQVATTIWPDVYATYRVVQDANIWKGTKWEGWKNGYFPRIRARILTGWSDGGTNNPRDWEHRDVVVEYQNDSMEYHPAQRYDDLTISFDGTYVRFNALRDIFPPQTWKQADQNNAPYLGSGMTKRYMRMTLALEADWRIVGEAGIAGTPEEADPNSTRARVNNEDEQWTWLAVQQQDDYVEWLRKDSEPCGVAQVPSSVTTAFPDRATEGNELFTDRVSSTTGRIVQHANARLRDVKRIEYSGQVVLPRIATWIEPGMPVGIAGDNTIKCVGVIKMVTLDTMTQSTTIEMGGYDSATIYSSAGGYVNAFVTTAPAPSTFDPARPAAKQAAAVLDDEPGDTGIYNDGKGRRLVQ